MRRVIPLAAYGLNLIIIVTLWALSSGSLLASGGAAALLALARLAGLLAATCVLTQLLLIGRTGWIERGFGLDRLSRVHHWNGFAIVALALTHPALVNLSHAALNGLTVPQQVLFFMRTYPSVILAELALLGFVTLLVTGLGRIRSRWRYEVWYTLHFCAYAVILSVFIHQLRLGGDLAAGALRVYWIALWAFCVGNLVAYRFIRPITLLARHGFRVARIVPETSDVHSVYIEGRNLARWRYEPGQFVIVRFLRAPFIWEAHPFSLSCVHNGAYLRLSIKGVGDFTRKIPQLRPGTRVLIDGPHGGMTPRLRQCDKVLLIAGGIGITPLRALAEHFVGEGRSVTLLYGNRNEAGVALRAELEALAAQGLVLHHVLSHEPGYSGEKGFVDRERIARLAPDAAERDVYVCGPPMMMNLVRRALAELGVPRARVHWERFAL